MTTSGCGDSLGTSSPAGIAEAACRLNSAVRVCASMSRAAATASSVNWGVRKIGVSEMRKSAGQRTLSFTQRSNASYLSAEKSALNRERSCGSIGAIRPALRWTRLFDYAVDVERPKHCTRAVVRHNDYTVAPRRDEHVIHGRDRILMTVGSSD